jgi:cob(I)alamin adenosyltransferase
MGQTIAYFSSVLALMYCLCYLAHFMLKTIEQLNTHSDNTLVNRSISLPTPDLHVHKKIRLIDTPGDKFATEIVANALKLAGMGRRVLVVQLLKGGIRQGHDRIVNLAQNLDWIRCNLIRNIAAADLNDLELHNFQQLWKHVRGKTLSNRSDSDPSSEYSLIILDELSLAIDLGLIGIEAATNFLTTLPEDLEIVLTGTSQHPALVKLASI